MFFVVFVKKIVIVLFDAAVFIAVTIFFLLSSAGIVFQLQCSQGMKRKQLGSVIQTDVFVFVLRVAPLIHRHEFVVVVLFCCSYL